VRTKTVEDLTKTKIDEISKFAADQLGLAQRSLKRKNSYLVLPEDWIKQMPSFATLSAAIAAEFGIPAPTVSTSGDAPLTLEAVAALPGLGRATTPKFGQPMRAAQLVTAAKELSAPNQTTPVQKDVASPALTDDKGDVYFFRITEALPSVPATDLAVARERVLGDLLALDRFQWLEKNEATISKEAATDGLRSVADKYGAKIDFVRELRQFNSQVFAYGFRMGSPIPGLGADPKALAALVDKASALPLTADLSKIPAADRTFAVVSPDKLSIVLLQVTELYPVSRETMNGLLATPEVVRATRDDAVAIDLKSVFGFDAVASRIGFKRIRLDDEKAGDKKPAGEEPAKTASAT
jgi:hypothetical protein